MLLNFFNLISPTVLATLNFFNPISEPSEMFPHLYNFISEPSEMFPHLCNYISEPSEMISHLYNFISEPSEMILNFFRAYSRKQKDTEPTCDPVSSFIFICPLICSSAKPAARCLPHRPTASRQHSLRLSQPVQRSSTAGFSSPNPYRGTPSSSLPPAQS